MGTHAKAPNYILAWYPVCHHGNAGTETANSTPQMTHGGALLPTDLANARFSEASTVSTVLHVFTKEASMGLQYFQKRSFRRRGHPRVLLRTHPLKSQHQQFRLETKVSPLWRSDAFSLLTTTKSFHRQETSGFCGLVEQVLTYRHNHK